jgi:molecular chaperone GrpE
MMAEADENKQDPEKEEKPAQEKAPESELDKARKEAADYKDKYLRGLAESENARKRILKEKQEYVQYSLQNLIADFLAPIDHFENALKFAEQASAEVKHWASGFEMILIQFKDVLSQNGVQPFESVGTHFDPHLHEAVEVMTTIDYPPGTIIEESLRGYKMGDRTIRPARVKVAKAPPAQPQEQDSNKQAEK